MGKYPGYYTTQDVSKCECREASHILRKFGVPRKARKHIISMIKEPWFQFGQSNKFHSDYSKYLKEIWDIDLDDPKYIRGYFSRECMNAKGSFMKFIGKAVYGVDKNSDLRKLIRENENG